jgi:hypothetical protein
MMLTQVGCIHAYSARINHIIIRRTFTFVHKFDLKKQSPFAGLALTSLLWVEYMRKAVLACHRLSLHCFRWLSGPSLIVRAFASFETYEVSRTICAAEVQNAAHIRAKRPSMSGNREGEDTEFGSLDGFIV